MHIEAAPAIVIMMSLLNSRIFSIVPPIYATPELPPYVTFLSAARTIPSLVTIPSVVVPVFSICFLDSSFILRNSFRIYNWYNSFSFISFWVCGAYVEVL